MNYIYKNFPVTIDEFNQLFKQLGKLCYKAGWQLKSKNINNDAIYDAYDFHQDLICAMIKAGSYSKRQVYIERSLELVKEYAVDDFIKDVVDELMDLWENRTRHGANRQKFGEYQEIMLDELVSQIVPDERRPSKAQPLLIDTQFIIYCKQIIWNTQKSLGKHITKRKPLRANQVSLSDYSYLDEVGL